MESINEKQTGLLPWQSIQNQSEDNKSKYGALIYLDHLNKFYIYDNIQIFDRLFDSPEMTRNCFTIRNQFYQQIYFMGTQGNRRPGTILPFTLRIVDQYNRLVIKLKKYIKPCFTEQVIDIECPPGKLLAKIIKNRVSGHPTLFFIKDSKSADNDIKFLINRQEKTRSRNQFIVLGKDQQKVASVTKRYEKVLASDKSLVYEDHFLRVNIESAQVLEVTDKAIILSAALILNIYFMSK